MTIRSFLLLSLATLGLSCTGSAQLLQSVSGSNTASADDIAQYWDLGGNPFAIEYQNQSITTALNAVAGASTNPWSAAFDNGVVSSNGEYATAQGTLSNGASAATFSALVDGSAQLSSSVPGLGSGYTQELATSSSTSDCTISFTPEAATELSATGDFLLSGLLPQIKVSLVNNTTSQTTYILNQEGTGTYDVNFTQQLTVGDSYTLDVNATTFPYFAYLASGSYASIDSEIATGALTANFVAAPEPAAWMFLGISAVAVLRRRKS
jgi:hypothetical protein